MPRRIVAIAVLAVVFEVPLAVGGVDSSVILEVVVPASGNVADLTARLYNNGGGPIFLDPVYPQAAAFVERHDPVTGRWEDISKTTRCSTVDPEQTFRVEPTQTFAPEVILESLSVEHQACLELQAHWRQVHSWRLQRGEEGDMEPELPGGCVPPQLEVAGASLRLRMEYSTQPWSMSSTNVERQTVYSSVFSLSD